MALQSVFSEQKFWTEKFSGNKFCEKNWFYVLLEPCFVQKIGQNGLKVKIAILLNFGQIDEMVRNSIKSVI